MRNASGRFKFTHLMQSFYRGGPGKSSARTQCVRSGVQRSDNHKMARCGPSAKGCRQRLKGGHVSDHKRWKRAWRTSIARVTLAGEIVFPPRGLKFMAGISSQRGVRRVEVSNGGLNGARSEADIHNASA